MFLLFSTIVFVLASSAFLSFSEASVTSLSTIKTSLLAKQKKNKSADILHKIVENKSKNLTTIIILNTIVNVAGSSVIGVIAGSLMNSFWIGVLTVVFTLAILFFSELIPKLYAAQNSEKVGLKIAIPLQFLSKAISPLVKFSAWVCKPFIKPIKTPIVTLNEVRYMIEAAEDEGLLKHGQKSVIDNLIKFTDKKISDILKDSCQVEGLCAGYTLSSLQEQILSCVHRRIVIQDHNNYPVGIVRKSELLQALLEGEGDRLIDDFMLPVLVEDNDSSLVKLMMDLDGVSYHMAIIRDENNQLIGILSSEDLMHVMVKGIQSSATVN